jgi:hypothetical protein
VNEATRPGLFGDIAVRCYRWMLARAQNQLLEQGRHHDAWGSWRNIGANGLPGELTWEEFVASSSRARHLQNIASTRPFQLLTWSCAPLAYPVRARLCIRALPSRAWWPPSPFEAAVAEDFPGLHAGEDVLNADTGALIRPGAVETRRLARSSGAGSSIATRMASSTWRCWSLLSALADRESTTAALFRRPQPGMSP